MDNNISEFEHTKDMPYIALTNMLRGTFHKDLETRHQAIAVTNVLYALQKMNLNIKNKVKISI